MSASRARSQHGFTLIEVMVTMLILLVGLAGAVTLIDGANAITVSTKQREAATNLQRELIEGARAVPYDQLTPNGLQASLQARPGLGDTTAGGAWTIERRGTTFTVSTTVCSVDDPRDGSGDQSSGTFCAGQATGSADSAPDDFKRVVVDVTWESRGTTSSSRQATIVTNPSSNLGPDVLTLTRSPDDEIIVDDISSIAFTATTSMPAEAVRFLVDGVVTGVDTPAANDHDAAFSWNIGADSGVVDGTYVISATALNSAGLTGPSRSLTVRLNRHPPAPVTGLIGGWNATRGGVELEWNLNEESDIAGYRIYRRTGSDSWTLLEQTGPDVAEWFDDLSVPFAASYEYRVVALDQPSESQYREGAPSASLVVAPSLTAPNPPGTVTAQQVAGKYQLDWTAPAAPAIPYAGDGILFFRIYRGSSSVDDRFDRTGLGTELSFLDTTVNGETRQYWVTSVDENYSESMPVGPVTLPVAP